MDQLGLQPTGEIAFAHPAGVEVRVDAPTPRATRRIDALLDAAATLIATNGREALTTADVAEQAEVSIGTVYRYFPDRTALLDGLGARIRRRVRRHLREVLAVASPGLESVARAIVWAVRATSDAEPSYVALGVGERIDPLGRDACGEAWGAALEPAIGALQRLGADEPLAREACVRAALVADALLRCGTDAADGLVDAVVHDIIRRSLDRASVRS